MGTAAHPDDGDALWRTFVDPPDEARPRAWWHWMDGNIDPAGIRRDLRWLHGVGVRGVQLFDGGMGMPLVVPEAVRPGSDAWDDAVAVAADEADALGLELAVATSSGWSASGAPFVEPADAMKKIVWSEVVVSGDRTIDLDLPALPAVAGPYQDCPRWGADGSPTWNADWRVVAFPADGRADVLAPDAVAASAPLAGTGPLTDGRFDATVALPRDPDAASSAWIDLVFDEPVEVGAVTVGLPGPSGFGAAPAPSAVLLAGPRDGDLREIARLPASAVPVRSATFAPVTAQRFRLSLSGRAAAEAIPPVADGVRLPPVLRRVDAFHVSEFAVRGGGRVHRAEEKAGFAVVDDYYAIDSAPAAEQASVDPTAVVDLTDHVRDGRLTWDAPPGRWRVLRLGASLTGQTNGPAPADSTGLEVDKLDGARVRAYLDRHLARFGGGAQRRRDGRAPFAALLSDSIEAGQQNWTDAVAERFAEQRGYNPAPWLPALAGYAVGRCGASDRFLYDYRRTIADLLAREYYGTLAAEADARGMPYYAEALEDRRPQLGDDLAMRAHADVPMGAMWTFDPAAGPRPTYVADLTGAASVAHVHGKRWTGSEAFTSFDAPWSWTPRTLKHIADLQLALGVTRFCIHTSPHQPLAAEPPGIALAPFLGQAFTVNETWESMARPWIDYLARCCAVLSAGEPVVDVAVFVGEEAPVTGLFGDRVDAIPDGFAVDYVGPDALARILRVEDGSLVSDGASYRLLHLGGSSSRMTIGALVAIERLLDAGAVVSGARPDSSPSLADDPAEFTRICDRIWGAGRVVEGDLRSALTQLGVEPRVRVSGAPVRTVSRLVEGDLVTFIANPTGDEVSVTIRPSDPVALHAWDPVRVRRVPLPRTAEGFRVRLGPFESLFAVPGSAPPAGADVDEVELTGTWTAAVDGADITSTPDPELWTDRGAGGFSGVAAYRHTFALDEVPDGTTFLLELSVVRDIARVLVNGHDCGVVWTAPFVCDVSHALRPGSNELEVRVGTPWRNRLIAEAGAPSGTVFAPMTDVFESTATPIPAGLAGRCRIRALR